MNQVILVVDDEEDERDAMARLLHRHHYAVESAANGRDALDRLRQGASLPALVLLDLNMPVMDGWEFAEHVGASADWADIPIVVITASTAISRGPTQARAFLTKPVAFDRLIGVTTHCEAHRHPPVA